jgi:hypothetical protein
MSWARPESATQNLNISRVPALTLTCVNADVHSVHLSDGSHVGNLKRIGAVWKFKAIGYDAAGNIIPGGGPLTDRHNTMFAAPDADAVSAKLG